MSRSVPAVFLPLALLATSGCGWVDATGRQNGSGSAAQASLESPGVPVPLGESVPLVLTERTARDVRLAEPDATLRDWRWRPLDEAIAPELCAGVPGFDTRLAERALRSACSESAACALDVEEIAGDGATRFRLRLPALRAPVAAAFALSARRADGSLVERRQTLCGLSVNEAPLAGPDRVTVAPGATLEVGPGDAGDLLANDRDDDDVRNRPLAIAPVPARAPRHAELFELGRDGGFRYRPAAGIALGAGGRLEDSFAYTLSDGLHEVVGEVVVVISRANRAPLAPASLPDIELAVGGGGGGGGDDDDDGNEDDGGGGDDGRDAVYVDLSRFFDDPDGDPLSFELAPGSLPPNGGLSLGRDGALSGRIGSADIGVWRLTLRVSDGRDAIERDLRLLIVREFERNTPPTVTDIDNVTFKKRFRYDVAPYFDDADGDRLSFSARGLPDEVEIDETGRIEGRSTERNRGRWFVVVEADDGRGGRIEDGFRLTLK